MAKKTGPVDSHTAVDVVQMYLDDVSRHSMISKEEEVRLSNLFRDHQDQIAEFEQAHIALNQALAEGLPRSSPRIKKLRLARQKAHAAAGPGLMARETFLQANLRLVVYYAHKFNTWSSLDLSDLIQEGNIGLMKALEKFDPDKGFKFSTYASWWIKQSMNRATQKLGSEIRIPAHRLEHIDKLAEGRAYLRRQLDREPSYEELEEYLDISLKKLQEADLLPRVTHSIWSPVDEGDDTRVMEESMADFEAFDPEEVTVEVNIGDWVQKHLDELPERDYLIFKYRYGFDGEETHSLEQIGKKVGLTRERVRQIIKKWQRKFKHQAEQDGLG